MSTSRDRRRHRIFRPVVPVFLACAALLTSSSAARSDACELSWGETLIVPDGCTYVVTGTESYGYIYVASTGILELASGASLDVKFSIYVEPDGIFRFNATGGGTRPTLRAIRDLDISGTITVAGSGGGLIERSGSNTITLHGNSRIVAEGGDLTITAPLLNNGTVRAGGTGHRVTFAVASPAPESSGRFEVTHDDAEMVFAIGSGVTFTGGPHFDLQAGGFVFADSVSTNGGVRVLSGTIMVLPNKVFQATGPFVEPS